MLEVPAGGMDPGETPEEAVIRELREETGFTADTLAHLCNFWLAPGWCTEYMYAYMATGLSESPLSHDEDEDISLVWVPLSNIPNMIHSGEIQDSKSIASLLVALQLTSSN